MILWSIQTMSSTFSQEQVLLSFIIKCFRHKAEHVGEEGGAWEKNSRT